MSSTKVYFDKGYDGTGRTETIHQRVKAGGCVAVRVTHRDGTIEDLVFGGNDKEQQAALARLHAELAEAGAARQ